MRTHIRCVASSCWCTTTRPQPPTERRQPASRTRQDRSSALKTTQQHLEFTAPRDDNARLANLCGPLDENLRQIEQALDVTLQRRGHRITIRGRGAKLALTALERFYNNSQAPLSVDDIQLALVEVRQPARHRANGNGHGA